MQEADGQGYCNSGKKDMGKQQHSYGRHDARKNA
jgi:hypothetical protein